MTRNNNNQIPFLPLASHRPHWLSGELCQKAVLLSILLLFAKLQLSSLERQPELVEKYLPTIELSETNSAIPPIDCIYVINLDARNDRWKWMQALCEKHFISPNRVSAVNGWALPQEARDELTTPYPCRLRGGQFGCLLSHLSVLKDAEKRNFDLIWVMEDDVEFVRPPQELPAIIAQLYLWDPSWDILYTDRDFRAKDSGYIPSLDTDFPPDMPNEPALDVTERIYINDDLMQIRSRFGTHSMLISRNGIRKILEYFTVRPFWTAIDIELHYIPHIHEYATCKDIASNRRDSLSDTETDNAH